MVWKYLVYLPIQLFIINQIVSLLCRKTSNLSSNNITSKNQFLTLACQLSDLTISHLPLASHTPATVLRSVHWTLRTGYQYLEPLPRLCSAMNVLPPEPSMVHSCCIVDCYSKSPPLASLPWGPIGGSHSLPQHSPRFSVQPHLILSRVFLLFHQLECKLPQMQEHCCLFRTWKSTKGNL